MREAATYRRIGDEKGDGAIMYVICDKDRKLLQFNGVKLFGVKVDLLACFDTSRDALNVLFEMENAGLVSCHTVEDTGDSFTVTR